MGGVRGFGAGVFGGIAGKEVSVFDVGKDSSGEGGGILGGKAGFNGFGLDSLKKKLFVDSADVEFFSQRKDYASNVTGAYYAARLAVAEFLVEKKRQAAAIVFREIG